MDSDMLRLGMVGDGHFRQGGTDRISGHDPSLG